MGDKGMTKRTSAKDSLQSVQGNGEVVVAIKGCQLLMGEESTEWNHLRLR